MHTLQSTPVAAPGPSQGRFVNLPILTRIYPSVDGGVPPESPQCGANGKRGGGPGTRNGVPPLLPAGGDDHHAVADGLMAPGEARGEARASPPRGGLLCDAGIGADAGGESVDATEGVKISVHGSPRRSLCLALPQVVAQSRYKFFGRNAKRLTHSQHREYRYRASGLDHLPVAHTEAKGDHVLLGQLMFHPVRPNSVAQGAEVPAITVWDLSAGTHSFKAGSLRARTPRTKVRIGEGKGGCKADHKSLYSVCPDEPLSFAMLGEKPGDLSDVHYGGGECVSNERSR